MADLGDIATIGSQSDDIVYTYQETLGHLITRQKVYTDRLIYTKSQSNSVNTQFYKEHPVELNSVFSTDKIRLYNYTKLIYKWFIGTGLNEIPVDIQQSEANDYDAIIRVYVPDDVIVFNNDKTLTSKQTIDVSYNNPYGNMVLDVELIYKFTNSIRKATRYVDWFIPETVRDFGDLSLLNPQSGSGGSLTCPSPIGEEKPIDYGNISLTGSTATTLTFTIPANTVASTVTDAQILLTLSPYGSNLNGDIEDIFTALTTNWQKMYVYDGLTSLKLDIEFWNNTDNFSKVWVTIPSLTTAQTDIVLHHDATDLDNPDSTHLSVIGF